MLITRRNVDNSHKDVYIPNGHNCDMHLRGLYTSLYLSLSSPEGLLKRCLPPSGELYYCPSGFSWKALRLLR